MTWAIANEALNAQKRKLIFFRTELVKKHARPVFRFSCFVVGASVVQHVWAGLSGFDAYRQSPHPRYCADANILGWKAAPVRAAAIRCRLERRRCGRTSDV